MNLDHISAFDFTLPENLIATEPANPRDAARLMVWPQTTPQKIFNHTFKDLPNFLKKGDLLVLNNTKVIPARLFCYRDRTDSHGVLDGTKLPVELLLHRPVQGALVWESFAKPAKRLKEGQVLKFENSVIEGKILARDGDRITFEFTNTDADGLDGFLEEAGEMPLPPYIARPDGSTSADKEDYQTVYAAHKGSVAAPTAGLHFTDELLESLKAKGVELVFVTLHVGAGTFQPVRVEDINEHKMHAEFGVVSQEVAEKIKQTKQNGGRVIPVGTTSMRLLESAARNGDIKAFNGDTDIFIRPGFKFNVADMMITNFHLPKSTLLMLISAFMGYTEAMKMYENAIAEGFKFYSYGDGCLLTKKKNS